MSDERSQQVYELFTLAFPLGPAERERLLEQKCAGDSRLRANVEELLARTWRQNARSFCRSSVR